jgi:signal peptidase I
MMNFALWLFIASVVCGLIYVLDVLVLAKKRSATQPMPKIIEYARSFFPVFVIVLLLRSFLIEPFRIPSGSLEPTLLVGDFVAVNKFIYGIRLPIIEKKIIQFKNPKTGDIVVFRWPPDPSYDYIKRVIGVPGDHITYHNKVLTINGKIAQQKFIRYTTDPSSEQPVSLYRENLNGIEHDIFIRTDLPAVDFDVTVPKDHYFMMGDNRDDSADSRYWGFVADEFIRGKALLTWMSWDSKTTMVRWHKIGQLIH